MFSVFSKFLCSTLALSLVFTPILQAQQTTSGQAQQAAPNAAPVPAQIASARRVFVSNGGGNNYFDMFTGGPDRAYNSFYADLRQSSQYQLVGSPAEADLIFEIRAIAPSVDTGNGVAYNPQLILSILDPQTRAVLWTTSANVRALGTKKRRDQGFDQSMAVLVDKLAQITGQPLTAEQVKAVKQNSRMSTAAKVFIVVAIAASVVLTTYGIYRVTHPPTLTPPALPAER
jgi:hypothetical protein